MPNARAGEKAAILETKFGNNPYLQFLMRFSVILLAAASVACAVAIPIGAPAGAGICANATYAKEKTLATLDVQRYMGVWYEQGRSKNFIFDNNCYCTTANYTLETGYIGVNNRCRKNSVSGNLTKPLHGKATCPDPKYVTPCPSPLALIFGSRFPAYLKIQFSPIAPSGVYEVAATDYDNYSIIFSCTETPFLGGALVWIVTRTAVIDDSSFTNLVHQASNFGLDMSDFIRTEQVGCPSD